MSNLVHLKEYRNKKLIDMPIDDAWIKAAIEQLSMRPIGKAKTFYLTEQSFWKEGK